ncbi:hypothetical protein SynBOUM118_02322 [Synechococcus sp. BOUM118]|nr:hypothetical protein SynBOUM118_02322 [Synechococcus sp. BOUM118]
MTLCLKHHKRRYTWQVYAEIMETYTFSYNNEYRQLVQSLEEWSEKEFSQDTKDWLRSSEGLLRLTQIWRTAVYQLKDTSSGVTSKQYKRLKSDIYLLGVDVFLENKTSEDEWEEEFQSIEGDWIKGTRKELRGTLKYVMVFNLCVNHENDTVDDLKSLPREVVLAMLNTLIQGFTRIDRISKEDCLTEREEDQDPYSGEVRYGNRYYKWDDWGRPNPFIDKTLSAVINIVDSTELVRDITGEYFGVVRKIVNEYRPGPLFATVDPEKKKNLFKGLGTTGWEEQLCGYLLQEGFIVSIEPDVFFPNTDTGRRQPDLLVFQKGRCIAIEIDSKYHLVHMEDKPSINAKAGEVNVAKWKDDRQLDRMMLCNGIPVLRVWYEEVENNPEKIMSEVLNIFESLGGDRMRYR